MLSILATDLRPEVEGEPFVPNPDNDPYPWAFQNLDPLLVWSLLSPPTAS